MSQDDKVLRKMLVVSVCSVYVFLSRRLNSVHVSELCACIVLAVNLNLRSEHVKLNSEHVKLNSEHLLEWYAVKFQFDGGE